MEVQPQKTTGRRAVMRNNECSACLFMGRELGAPPWVRRGRAWNDEGRGLFLYDGIVVDEDVLTGIL